MKEINRIYNQDCMAFMSEIDDNSIDAVITSPPYWQKRDYAWEGQWGLEPTIDLYIDNLFRLCQECHRVLKPTGSLWVNLGDTYNTESGNIKGGMKNKQINPNMTGIDVAKYTKSSKHRNKSLLCLPHRFAIKMTDNGWILRNTVIWAKHNAMPESVEDRFSNKYEFFFFFTKDEKPYFNLDAVREKLLYEEYAHKPANRGKKYKEMSNHGKQGAYSNPLGKNPGDVADFWDIPLKPNKTTGHIAAFNIDLLKKPILATTPPNGIILDPFMGSGTTAVAAIKLNRQFIGCEGSEKYYQEAVRTIDSHRRIEEAKLFQ